MRLTLRVVSQARIAELKSKQEELTAAEAEELKKLESLPPAEICCSVQ